MSYTRTITTRVSLVARRYRPSICYTLHDDEHKSKSLDKNTYQNKTHDYFKFMIIGNANTLFQLSRDTGPGWCRYMSSMVSDESGKKEFLNEVSDILSDTSVDTSVNVIGQQTSVLSEAAIAAADSYLPVASLQYLIDGVHSFTGLGWWASIALTTVLIRAATIPLLINQLKATSKLALMKPRLEELRAQVQSTGMDPAAVAEFQKKTKALFREYGVTPFTPMKGLLIQGPVFVSFYLAITNMTEKIPSFKEGGIYWFTDLTTPDSLYILPVLAGLSFLITVECNAQEGMEANPMAGTMKNVSRGLALATVFFTCGFPKAIFCYWVTSNLFSLAYGQVMKHSEVKKFLGVPVIPVAPPNTSPQPEFSLSGLIKRTRAFVDSTSQSQAPLQVEPQVKLPKPAKQKISQASVLNQKIKTLEKQVKEIRKHKKFKK